MDARISTLDLIFMFSGFIMFVHGLKKCDTNLFTHTIGVDNLIFFAGAIACYSTVS